MRLTELVGRLAKDTVRAQEILNEGFARDWQEFETLEEQIPEIPKDHLHVLAPSRSVIHANQVGVSLLVGIERLRGFRIEAVPLNLGYFIRHRVRSEAHSRIRVHVEQVPIVLSKPISQEEGHAEA